jgi:hypothetical protein
MLSERIVNSDAKRILSTQKYICRSAYGSGYCLKSGSSHTSYAATTSTVSSAPAGYSAPTMAGDLSAGLGLTVSIAIPTIPTSFFPGATPATKLCNGSCAGASGVATTTPTKTATTTTKAATTTTTASGAIQTHYGQVCFLIIELEYRLLTSYQIVWRDWMDWPNGLRVPIRLSILQRLLLSGNSMR